LQSTSNRVRATFVARSSELSASSMQIKAGAEASLACRSEIFDR